MTWLNEHEIDALVRAFEDGEFPVLRRGAVALGLLRDWVNSNSDGWPYWQAPAKAAGRLMEVLDDVRLKRYSLRSDLTPAELDALLRPVVKFLTGRGVVPTEVLFPPPPAPVRPAEVRGTIVMDGVESQFLMGADAESLYTQWGAPIPDLGRRVVLLARVAEVFRTFAAEELCSECIARTVSENDPFGQERLCDECINAGSCAASCSPDDGELMAAGGVCTECGTDWKQYSGGDWEVFRKQQMGARK